MSGKALSTSSQELDKTLDLTNIKPYGDTMNDGKVQLSFTLPIPNNEKGVETAIQLAKKMGLADAAVAYSESLDKEFSFYVLYGSSSYSINYNEITVEALEIDTMDMHQCEDYIAKNIKKEIVIVGASTGRSEERRVGKEC